jgi:hypothetical protein
MAVNTITGDERVFLKDGAGQEYWDTFDNVMAGVGVPVCVEATFTETTGAGTYAADVPLPAGAFLLNIIVQAVALWDTATSATMIVGDAGDPDGYFTGVDLKATDLLAAQSIDFNKTGGKEGAYFAGSATHVNNRYAAAARVITGSITTVGASGSAGRTRMLVQYVVPSESNVTAATKA